jgi:hypothetical protein
MKQQDWSSILNKKNNCSHWETPACDWEVRGHCMCKEMPVILVNRVVDSKRIIRKNGESRRRRDTRGRWPKKTGRHLQRPWGAPSRTGGWWRCRWWWDRKSTPIRYFRSSKGRQVVPGGSTWGQCYEHYFGKFYATCTVFQFPTAKMSILLKRHITSCLFIVWTPPDSSTTTLGEREHIFPMLRWVGLV